MIIFLRKSSIIRPAYCNTNIINKHIFIQRFTLSDIIGTIRKFLHEDKLPHLLFYGPPGTGKTSTILACAKEIYKPKEFNSMVLELNASDDRGK